jgi:DNA-binding transcriptional ArsR family regulator
MSLSLEIPRVFAALGDPVRAAIVERLTRGDSTVSELAAAFPISMQAVSKHIKLLEAAGLVSQTKVGRTRPVRLETAALASAAGWLEVHRMRRDASYERLDELLDELKGTP